MKFIVTILSLVVSANVFCQFKQIQFNPNIKISSSDLVINKPNNHTQNTNNTASLTYKTQDPSFMYSLKSGLIPSVLNERQVPVAISGKLKTTSKSRMSTEEHAFEYILSAAPLMKITNPENAFVIKKVQTDDIGITHVHLAQEIEGVPVYGAEIIVHGRNNEFDFLNGTYFPDLNIESVTPHVSKELAIQKTTVDLDEVIEYHQGLSAWFGLNQTTSELVIYPIDRGFVLAYHVTMYKNLSERWEYFINAQSGELIKKYESLCKFHNHKNTDTNTTLDDSACEILDGKAVATALDLFSINRTLNTYQVGNSYYMIDGSRDIFKSTPTQLPNDPDGVIWTIDAMNTSPEKSNFSYNHVTSGNNAWNNKTAVSAHYNGGKAFEYFRNVHGRASINGDGGNIISLINVSDSDGSSFGNAFWNGAAMFYGNGDSAFLPLARGLDVAGHEMTHGVVQSTANLEYEGESGALNESFADIFGAMIDRDDWKIGEDVVKTTAFPSGALRNLQDPHNGASTNNFNAGWQPKTYTERYKGTEDNGGVHLNSGIPNYAYYLFATAIGKDKAEKVYYRALNTYLTKSSQFVDCRIAVIKAATDLYGTTEANAAKSAFDQVGVVGDQGGSYEVDAQTNPGKEFILTTNSDYSGLYLYDTQGNKLGTVSTTGIASRPSVSDDGSEIVFVGDDNKIHYIYIDWSATQVVPNESIIGSSPIWRNAIISKDGSKIAALSLEKKNEIVVYYFSNTGTTNNTFTLYNPTYSAGVTTGDVNYADAMEFDISGEYIIYDSENEISSATAGSITYWDISFIKVWNNASQTFSLGKVEKLYSSLPQDVSVGNPTFSKNSPYIIAFDYIDENGDVSMLGANIEQGEAKLLYQNNTLSYPNYSSDDKSIVFDNDGISATNTGIVDLKTNKIEAASGPFLFLEDSRWAVWFSNGDRVLSDTEDQADVNTGTKNIWANSPFNAQLVLNINIANNNSHAITVLDITGKIVHNQNLNPTLGNNTVQIDTQSWSPGVYVINLLNGTSSSSLKIMKIE